MRVMRDDKYYDALLEAGLELLKNAPPGKEEMPGKENGRRRLLDKVEGKRNTNR